MAKDLFRLMHALMLPAGESQLVTPWQPAADVQRTRDGFYVKFELAGVRPDEIDLEVLGNRMTLRGVRHDCHQQAGRYYLMEIAYSGFERSLEFPCNLERADLFTHYPDGML